MVPSLINKTIDDSAASNFPDIDSPSDILSKIQQKELSNVVKVYNVVINAKNQIKVPRELLGFFREKAFMIRGFQERSLLFYPLEKFEIIEKKLHDLDMKETTTRQLQRFILSNTFEVELDSRNMIRIPTNFRLIFHDQSELVFVKEGAEITLWTKEAYEKLINNNEQHTNKGTE
jgi:division/cell wall cluster transcriptional repressor MraZ